MHLADAFIQSNLQCSQVKHFVSVCVPWELNPEPFTLLTQCSTTEPQDPFVQFDGFSLQVTRLLWPVWLISDELCVMVPLCWSGWQRQWSVELRDFPVDERKQSFFQFSVVPLQLSMVLLLIRTDQRLVLPQSILTPETKALQLVG